jgi:putative acetyltransferase
VRCVLIRRETPADVVSIAEVTTAAFARPDRPGQDPPEPALIDALRGSEAWLPGLSMVATEPDGQVIGHVLATRGHVLSTIDSTIDSTVHSAPALALAPLSVHPDHQRRGVGSALMHAILGAADALGEPLAALLGDPRYYERFGFRPGTDYQIQPPVPEWRPHFLVRPLSAYRSALRGTFTYPEPFDRV